MRWIFWRKVFCDSRDVDLTMGHVDSDGFDILDDTILFRDHIVTSGMRPCDITHVPSFRGTLNESPFLRAVREQRRPARMN